MREFLKQLECPIVITVGDDVYNVSVTVDDTGYMITFVNPSNYEVLADNDLDIIEGVGDELKDAVADIKQELANRLSAGRIEFNIMS